MSDFKKPSTFSKKNSSSPKGKSFFNKKPGPRKDFKNTDNKSFGDRPKPAFGDRERSNFGDRPKPAFGDRERSNFGDRPKPAFGDRERSNFGDRPRSNFGDRPKPSFGDRERSNFGDRPRSNFGDRPKPSFGDRPRSNFGDRPKPSFGDRPRSNFGDRPKPAFGDRPRSNFGDRPKPAFGDRERSNFGDRERPAFRDRNSFNNKFKEDKKTFNRSGFEKRTQKDRPQSSVSLENILHLFANNKGVINIKEQSFLPKVEADFLNKIEVLIKFDIVSTKDNTNFKVNTTQVMLNLDKFVIAKIVKPLIHDHYLVNVVALDGKKLDENEFIINNLKEELKDRFMVLELSLLNEKITAKPLFYLKEFEQTNLEHLKKAPLENFELKGIYKKIAGNDVIITINYRSKDPIFLQNTPTDLTEGSLIKAKLILNNNTKFADFLEIIAQTKESTSLSMLSVHQYNLPFQFTQQALDEAQEQTSWELENRKDVRNIPLVTIDDEDAKDFDDAIYAEKISDSPLKYKIFIAIADVSSVVKVNSQLDNEAQLRGNSVYLPGFVIPMLPESISNGLCSLNPNVDRGCMLAEIIINHNGEIESYEFSKALMKSKARLTYTKVQLAVENNFDAETLKNTNAEDTIEILDSVIKPIYEAFKLLNSATKKRHALNITTKETKIVLDKDDNILDIKIRENKEANKIVEEFMVAANVAAARFIFDNQKGSLTCYRVHDKPSVEKLMEFGKILRTLGLYDKVPEEVKNGAFFNELTDKYKNEPFFNSLNENILRTQAQAVYSTNNIGHFGLALKQYAHFTSPIRRYSDLMVHRLIANILDSTNHAFNYHVGQVNEICEHISNTERTAFFAEMAAKERIMSKWLSSKIGEIFEGQISSITQSGLFINLKTINASGLLPMRLLSKNFVKFNPNNYTVVDQQEKKTYKIGDNISVKLMEANEIKGMLTFCPTEEVNEKQNYRKKR